MKRLQFSILALFGWFFIFYNIERLYAPINLASFVYLLAPALGMLLLCVPRLGRVPAYWYFPMAMAAVVGLRYLIGYRLDGNAFSLAITEGCATWLTIWLSGQLAKGIKEYQDAAATAIFSHVSDCRPFEEAQSDIVREVRRARQFDRPIAVLALNPTPGEDTPSLDRFTEEFKNVLLQQYVSARAADCVSTQLRQHDILAQSGNQLIALLPEMSRQQGLQLAEQMRAELRKQTGLDLQVGISMFPEDEITAIGLIESAESDVKDLMAAASTASEDLAEQAFSRTDEASPPAGRRYGGTRVESAHL